VKWSLNPSPSHNAFAILYHLRSRPEKSLQNFLDQLDQPPWKVDADRGVNWDNGQHHLNKDEAAAAMQNPTFLIQQLVSNPVGERLKCRLGQFGS
jgi:hypothetical protein